MRYLLVTDLDNTLVGDPSATLRLNRWIVQRRDRLALAYATGRSYPSARQLKKQADLLEPDYWITGVGSEIYHQNEIDTYWADQISPGWDWETVWSIAMSFTELSPQISDNQNAWKASFTLAPSEAPWLIPKLQTLFHQADLPAQLIYSGGEHLDILPQESGKGLAASYIRQKLNIAPQRTLACGDSGNDLTLFEQSTLGILVGNSQPDLLAWYETHRQPRLYLAQAAYAAGIWEGLEAHGVTHILATPSISYYGQG
jgi:sucrose-6-phosphatase